MIRYRHDLCYIKGLISGDYCVPASTFLQMQKGTKYEVSYREEKAPEITTVTIFVF